MIKTKWEPSYLALKIKIIILFIYMQIILEPSSHS